MIKTVLQTITDGAAYLEKRGVENGRLNMEHLLAHVLKCKRMQLYLWFDRPLSESELAPLRELTLRRGKREPLQHLLGTVEFCGREFLTDARALIPRPETEELIERITASYKSSGTTPATILDLGTGSGIIGLTLALTYPEASVTLADTSPDALALTAANAAKLELSTPRVQWIETSLWSALAGQTFDLVAANLPYIPAAEIPTLSPEVQHDPVLALDGGEIGTELMLEFIAGLPAHLNPTGRVAMEIGLGQGPELCRALELAGLKNAHSVLDYAGRERFVFAELP
jgi:release factor glutamine methyltransferase